MVVIRGDETMTQKSSNFGLIFISNFNIQDHVINKQYYIYLIVNVINQVNYGSNNLYIR